MFIRTEEKHVKVESGHIRRRRTWTKGFSLIEVMISLFILSVSMLALCSLLVNAIHQNAKTKQLMIAQDVATKEIEALRTAGFFGLQNNSFATTSLSYVTQLSSLNSIYQFSGINQTVPANNFVVYKGITMSSTVQNGSDIATVNQPYTIKLTVNPRYLQYFTLAQGTVQIYWMYGTTLKNASFIFYVGAGS